MNAIIYLHGFASVGDVGRLRPLQARLPNYEIFSPTYNPHDANETIDFLKKYIKEIVDTHDTVVLIGNSMGGFWADFFGRLLGLRVILLNPAVDTKNNMMQFIGKNKNFKTGSDIEVTAQQIDDLDQVNSMRRKMPHTMRAVLINKDDDVIPAEFAQAEFAKNAKVIAFDKGGHRWTNWDAVADELTMLGECIIL